MSVYDLYVRSLQYVLTRLLVDIGYSLTVSYNLEMVMICDRVGTNVNLTMKFLLRYDCRFWWVFDVYLLSLVSYVLDGKN